MDATKGVLTPSGLDQTITTLIQTYRELNTKYRQIDEEKLVASGIRDIIVRMRGDELRFAQALKERVTGIPTMIGNQPDARLKDQEANDDPTVMIISQFGNARATTLSLLQDVGEGQWTATLDDGSTLLQHIQLLAQSDLNQLKRIADKATSIA